MSIGEVNNQAVNAVQDTPQLNETTNNVSDGASAKEDQASQEAIANLVSMGVVTSMIQSNNMLKQALSKGSQGYKELIAEINEEEKDREAEEGIPAY